MNRVLSLGVSVPTTCVRRLTATEVRCRSSSLAKLKSIKEKQLHFQRDDDVPVYIKGGATDKLFFFGTSGLIIFSVIAALHSTYKLATKK